MSDDSGEDFGGPGTTAPKVPAKRKASRKPTSRAEAGPSSRPASTAAHKKTSKAPSAEDSDVQLIEAPRDLEDAVDGDEDEDEVVQIDPPPSQPPRSNRKTATARAASVTVNGKSTAKGKGKMKDVPPKPAKKNVKPSQVSNIDDLVDDEMDVDNAAEDVARAINTASGHKGHNTQGLAEQLRRAEAHIEDLKNQLEELFQVRNTEPEELLKQQQTHHQAQVQALESLIKELNAQITRKEPLLLTSEGSLFNILTREEADKETHNLQQQVKSWKAEVENTNKLLKERDDEIVRLRESEQYLKLELHQEIERGRSIANKVARAPPSASRGRNGGLLGSDDPKHTEVIKVYEDLTNLLVPAIKMQAGKYLDLDEWIFTCIYTYSDLHGPPNESKSLNFTLRFCDDLMSGESEPVTSKKQLVSTVHYLPLQLDKESPEFVQKLGFLNGAFTFERDQLSLFLRTLYDTMGDTFKNGSEDSGEEERG